MSTPTPPSLVGHIWRPLHPVDVPALRTMLAECAVMDGGAAPPIQRAVDNIETDTLAAVGNAGRIAAYVWLSPPSGATPPQITLDGRVHPDWRGRGVGSFLLRWGQARACTMLRKQGVLRVDLYADLPDAKHLLHTHGYSQDTPSLDFDNVAPLFRYNRFISAADCL